VTIINKFVIILFLVLLRPLPQIPVWGHKEIRFARTANRISFAFLHFASHIVHYKVSHNLLTWDHAPLNFKMPSSKNKDSLRE